MLGGRRDLIPTSRVLKLLNIGDEERDLELLVAEILPGRKSFSATNKLRRPSSPGPNPNSLCQKSNISARPFNQFSVPLQPDAHSSPIMNCFAFASQAGITLRGMAAW